MLDACFNRAGKSLLNVLRTASLDAKRQKSAQVGTEHLLLAIAREPDDLANKALASMKIDAGSTQLEVEQYHREREPSDDEPSLGARYAKSLMGRLCSKEERSEAQLILTDSSVEALLKAEDYSRFFGQDEIEPAHLLLGILDLREAAALKIFEEMSANLIFLRRQVVHLLAQRMAVCPSVVNLKTAVIGGLKELVDKHESSLDLVATLSQKSHTQVRKMPSRGEVLHMVCIGYLSDFLYCQVAFQRYLLEETLTLLANRTGSLDKEISAGVVAGTAQNLREEVRATIEHLWSHEYRLIDQMLNEAEYDVIGSMVEDLWWAQSEEIVLDQTFAAAIEDHRRAQILSLQERRAEITDRISKIKSRLDETVRQTFEKRTITA